MRLAAKAGLPPWNHAGEAFRPFLGLPARLPPYPLGKLCKHKLFGARWGAATIPLLSRMFAVGRIHWHAIPNGKRMRVRWHAAALGTLTTRALAAVDHNDGVNAVATSVAWWKLGLDDGSRCGWSGVNYDHGFARKL